MKFRWTTAPPQPHLAAKLAGKLKISTLLAQCLLNRGISEPDAMERFLAPRLMNLADPFRLPDMDAAVTRLLAVRERDEPFVLFGDYDVDGVSSTALLVQVFRKLGWRVNHYLPHRMDEGYGLTRDGVENCLKKYHAALLLAVDCGSTAVETIAWLKGRGVDVIVLDHHQVSSPPPAAVALVNPQSTRERRHIADPNAEKGSDDTPSLPGAFTELCSAGLAFKLAHALVKRGREQSLPGFADFDLKPLLDLVALGTVADVVPLVGENRIFVSAGLEKLNATTRPGLVALKTIAQSPEKLGVSDIGFQLAPRLNAAGRLENAAESLHLLLAENEAEATPLAQNLDAHNRERQKIERGIAEQVIGVVRSKFEPARDFVIVEGEMHWHIGVVGIVASRVLQQFYRPTFIIGGDGSESWRGSGRSIAGFDLAAALRECDDLLVRHGGHAMAAGLTIHPKKLDAFRARLNEIARRALRPEDLQPPLRLDAEVELREVSLASLTVLDQLKPFGQANPSVQFFARNLTHARPLQRLGADKQHVKMWVQQLPEARCEIRNPKSEIVEAVWWNAGKESLPVGMFDLAFVPAVNGFNGRITVQLKVLDWRAA